MLIKIKIIIYNLIKKSFTLIPVQKKVVFTSFYGKGYSDNPKYIAEELKKKQIKIIWFSKNIQSHNNNKIKFIKYKSLNYYYHLYTARVIIDNSRMFEKSNIKRKKQYYIQTWHGTPIKKIENLAKEKLSKYYIDCAKIDSEMCDLMVSGNEYTTNIMKNEFWYKGKVLEVGNPRNDILINKDIKLIRNIKNKFKLEIDDKILLYAPTFRNKKEENGINQLKNINLKKIAKKLKEKLGGNWIPMVRFHPNIMEEINFDEIKEAIGINILNGNLFDDMQEVLLITDFLIVDISSSILDFSLTKKPAVLFLEDEKEYKKERGVNIEFEYLPYEVVNSQDQLINYIDNYKTAEINKKIEKWNKKIKNKESGKASKILADLIESLIK